MGEQVINNWHFIDDSGTFRMEEPGRTSYLYFPLVNEAGMMSVVTPTLHGDAKTGQHTFLLPPVSVEDLHTSRFSRNFWIYVEGAGPWSATGESAMQIAYPEIDQVSLEAGLLWQRVTRRWRSTGIEAQITSFVPPSSDAVELMKVEVLNTSDRMLKIVPTAAIPLFGRSADNLRDHRHVTSLLNRAWCVRYGILLRPTLSFDERGHHPNKITYAVLGCEGKNSPPIGFYPTLSAFIGEGGTLEWPSTVVHQENAVSSVGTHVDGMEMMGGLRFADVTLEPGESRVYTLALGVIPETSGENLDEERFIQRYLGEDQFEAMFGENQVFWRQKSGALSVYSGNTLFDLWLKWVNIQPTLRRMFGNSFLPYHDYGRGGRGWRDLWQDSLALMLLEPETTGKDPSAGELLFNHFAGIRLDGSNATIIGSNPGEFKADRNNIPRVWMDHGLWPLITTRLYIDQTADLGFLLRQQGYFKDSHTHRCQDVDPGWTVEQGTVQHTTDGEIYEGSILEHLLVQHLTGFFNVGQHNNIKLEGADWNDGMDMAAEHGESVAFTALYAGNLRDLAQCVQDLKRIGITEVELMREVMPLLDGHSVDYSSPAAKQSRLKDYFNLVCGRISGQKVFMSVDDLSNDLEEKSKWLLNHLRANEWIQSKTGYRWFNGYYDNDGQRLEGDSQYGVRMTLTGQVFEIMCGIATNEQTREIIRAADHFLLDQKAGGYRLNSDFKEVLSTMGRCFGFAYGHKENGSVFSHMAVMYAFALYQRGYVREGYRVLDRLFNQCMDFSSSRMYPGIPEYFTAEGRGAYPYLTGSASWYLHTLITQVFGVRGLLGDLVLSPQLVLEQFDVEGKAKIKTWFAGRKIEVTYHNPLRLDYGQYKIISARLGDYEMQLKGQADMILPRSMLLELHQNQRCCIEVQLG